MRRVNIYFPIFVFTTFLVITGYPQKRKPIKHNSKKITIIRQKSYKREYCKNSVSVLYKLAFDSTTVDSMIYRPTFCKFDEAGNIYVMDYSTFYIHKFSPVKNSHRYIHTYFGRGKGKGPGEFVNPTDLKIYKDKIYIADPSNACVEVYSTSGKFIKWITLENHLLPMRLAIINNQLIIEPEAHTQGDLFYLYDCSGKLISSFGSYIDKANINNGVYHDNDILELSENRFCYLPFYLGFMGVYHNNNLMFVRETIDGVKKPETIHKEIIKGFFVNKIKKEYYTASAFTHNSEYLLLKAKDMKYHKSFYDVYDVNDLHYIRSIEKIPFTVHALDMKEELLTGIDDLHLYVWDIKNVLREMKE